MIEKLTYLLASDDSGDDSWGEAEESVESNDIDEELDDDEWGGGDSDSGIEEDSSDEDAYDDEDSGDEEEEGPLGLDTDVAKTNLDWE